MITKRQIRWRGLALVLALGAGAAPVRAEPMHGIAMYGDPALPPDFVSLPQANPDAPKGESPAERAAGSALNAAGRGPGDAWGGPLFRGLTRPGVVRYFLARTWGSKAIDEALWAYDLLTTRQPGAEYAPLAFLSAGLFSADIHTLYEQLSLPVWVTMATKGDFTDYRGKAIVEGRPNWRFSRVEGGAMPYFEAPEAFAAAYDDFLRLTG